jgi:hypothetical protein
MIVLLLKATTQFHSFFSSPEMQMIMEYFTIYHINAPGQEDRANPLPITYAIDQSSMLLVAHHLTS